VRPRAHSPVHLRHPPTPMPAADLYRLYRSGLT
jgi:hypothetical protein